MWLIERKTFDAMNLSQGTVISAEQQSEFQARDHNIHYAMDSGNHSEAIINISGVLTQSPDIMASLFGGGNTTYSAIINAIERAEAADHIASITYAIDSPGGMLGGLFEAIAAMQAVTKPTKVIVKSMCASAAYALATQADHIEASSVASMVGSVGTMISFDSSSTNETISNTASPKKNPDPNTEKGRAAVVEGLDAAYELFADAIATGRNTTIGKINANFGQGATLLAGEALRRGMIDAINKPALKAVTTKAAQGGQQMETSMDLSTFKAQHPDVYKAAFAEGEIQGKTQERDRVTAHLVAGEMSGQLETAVAAAKDGSEMTQSASMQYVMAAANRGDINDRQGDNSDGGDNPGSSSNQGDAETHAAKILEMAAEQCGVEVQL